MDVNKSFMILYKIHLNIHVKSIFFNDSEIMRNHKFRLNKLVLLIFKICYINCRYQFSYFFNDQVSLIDKKYMGFFKLNKILRKFCI
jgi:hypothetical protein